MTAVVPVSDSHSLSSRDCALAAVGFLLASALYTYPVARFPGTANRFDAPDALLNAWIVSWNVHELARRPFEVYDANVFFPEPGALAYSENLLTGALLAAPFSVVSDAPAFLFNAVLLVGFATTGFATFLLAHDVTRDRIASALAGMLFAFAPFRFAHIPHLQLQLAFGIPMILLLTRRVSSRESPLSQALLALAVPLTFGSSVYYAVFAATAVPWVVVLGARRNLRAFRRLAQSFGAGAVLTLPLALPYLDKLRGGAERTLATAREFSATPLDYLSSFSHVHGFLAKTHEPLFPGFVALGLAAMAMATAKGGRSGVWTWAAIAATGLAVSFGPALGLYSLLHELLPPYRALRVPSRAGVLFLIGVAVLAAMGASAVNKRAWKLVLLAVASAECLAAPLPLATSLPDVPAIYASVDALPDDGGALVELPMAPPERFQDNAMYVYRSAFHRRRIVNGYSGFVPASYVGAFERVMRGPLDSGLRSLARDGVRYVLAHHGRLGPRMERGLRDALEAGTLRIVAEAGDDRLYELASEPRPREP